MGRIITRIAIVLSAIGAINWGLIAFTQTQFDLVAYIANMAGGSMAVANALYGAIALSGVYVIITMALGATNLTMCD